MSEIFSGIWALVIAILFYLMGVGMAFISAGERLEKEAVKRGYGYFNENKEFVWK